MDPFKEPLARAVGRQKRRKQVRKELNAKVASCYKRFDRNGGQYDGRDLVPRRAAEDLSRAVVALGRVERLIARGRKQIRQIVVERQKARFERTLSRALDAMLENIRVSPRDLLKKVLSTQGLFLHDNDEVSEKELRSRRRAI